MRYNPYTNKPEFESDREVITSSLSGLALGMAFAILAATISYIAYKYFTYTPQEIKPKSQIEKIIETPPKNNLELEVENPIQNFPPHH